MTTLYLFHGFRIVECTATDGTLYFEAIAADGSVEARAAHPRTLQAILSETNYVAGLVTFSDGSRYAGKGGAR